MQWFTVMLIMIFLTTLLSIHNQGICVYKFTLTHICQVDPSILINWMSPFPIIGVAGEHFHFYSISNR